MEHVIEIVVTTVFDFFFAFLLYLLFSVIGIPFLDSLSYWQCFGLVFAYAFISGPSRLSDRISDL